MKIKAIPTIIAAAVSALISYGLYSWCKTDGHEILLAIGGFVCLFITLTGCIGLHFEGRTTTSTATVAGIFFVLMLISNVVFALVQFSTPLYIIVNGLLLLTMVLIIYSVSKAKQ